jgi:hypothetical protein
MRSNKKPKNGTIYGGIIWLLESRRWITKSQLNTFLSNEKLNVRNGKPNVIIPKLLSMSKRHNKIPIRKEIFTLLIAYNLRNYGGHNIRQQYVLTSKFDKIIEQLLMSLFLCIDV